MALIPLAFIGHEHADGHLMGFGIVLPHNLSFRDRAKILSPILFDEKTNEPAPLQLTMGPAGAWNILRETSLSPKKTLQTLTYVGPSKSWASVTPVVLDRMPKTDRVKNPIGWREEVAGIVAQSCKNVRLPEPIAVRVEKTPFFRGSLRAMPGQGGFPQLRAGRFQVHVAIEFDRPVRGPVLLGAGRFRGYGLMCPWANAEGR
jgi:CRISPR-associated protein Csb2